MHKVAILLALTLGLAGCLSAGDDDDDDDDDTIDAATDLDASGNGDAPPAPDGGGAIDAPRFADAPSSEIDATCEAICGHMSACYPELSYDQCFSGCSADLVDCSSAQMDAIVACTDLGCDIEAVAGCITATGCVET